MSNQEPARVLPAPWPTRLQHYAARHRQRGHVAQARVQHHATCPCLPDQPCLVGAELRAWEDGIEAAITEYQQRYLNDPPPMPRSWINKFHAWYMRLVSEHQLYPDGARSLLERQTSECQARALLQALSTSDHPEYLPARWLYEAWLAEAYGDETHHVHA